MEANVTHSVFGRMPDGTEVERYALTNSNGFCCKVITYGAAITELDVPDRTGKLGDVVLGFDNLPQYLKYSWCFGAVCGRVANRISNGSFSIDGKTFTLPKNEGRNTLHGGIVGFNKIVWKAEGFVSHDGPSVVLSHLSPDGDEGFPGNLNVTTIYTLTNDNTLRIEYVATTDKPTAVNLTNHSFFNLGCTGNVLNHILRLNATTYTPTDGQLIPTGEILGVANGSLDFTSPKPIGRDVKNLPGGRLGYDNNFVIDRSSRKMALAANVYEPTTGRTMEVFTDQPAVQLFTCYSFDGIVGKRDWAYPLYAGFCLETQHFPDSVNRPQFPSTILRPGETFRSITIYKFSTR